MNFKQNNGFKTDYIRSIDSENTSATREPVFHSTINTVMENPFERLNRDLNEIKMMLRMLLEDSGKNETKSDLIGLNEACDMLKLSSSTNYKMTAKNIIPVIKRQGSKKLIFSRSQLDTWVKESSTDHSSITKIVDEHLQKNLRKRRI